MGIDSIQKRPAKWQTPIVAAVEICGAENPHPNLLPSQGEGVRHRLAPWLNIVLFLALAAMSASIFFTTQTFHIFTIFSGSMSPTIQTGSIVAVPKQPQPNSYEPGDIITFRSAQGIITHRLIEAAANGSWQTQGDANSVADSTPVTAENIIGPVSFSIPLLGYLLVWLKTKLGFSLLILLPASFFILGELMTMKKVWQHLRQPVLAAALLVILVIAVGGIPTAQALLTSSAVVMDPTTITTAAVFPSPTPSTSPEPTISSSPTPSPTPGNCDLGVEIDQYKKNTGPGSTNENEADISTNCEIDIEHTSSSTTTININANTGNNSSSNNSDSGNIETGNIGVQLFIGNQ